MNKKAKKKARHHGLIGKYTPTMYWLREMMVQISVKAHFLEEMIRKKKAGMIRKKKVWWTIRKTKNDVKQRREERCDKNWTRKFKILSHYSLGSRTTHLKNKNGSKLNNNNVKRKRIQIINFQVDMWHHLTILSDYNWLNWILILKAYKGIKCHKKKPTHFGLAT